MTLERTLAQDGPVLEVPRTFRPRPIVLLVGSTVIGAASTATFVSTHDVPTLLLAVAAIVVMTAVMVLPHRCSRFDLRKRSLRHPHARGEIPFSRIRELGLSERVRHYETVVVRYYVLVCRFHDSEGGLDVCESDDRNGIAKLQRFIGSKTGLAVAIDSPDPEGTESFQHALKTWLAVLAFVALYAIAMAIEHWL